MHQALATMDGQAVSLIAAGRWEKGRVVAFAHGGFFDKTLDTRRSLSKPVDKLQPHRSAADFPGVVPRTARRVTQTLAIDTSIPRWHSTGLYAPPGEVVQIRTDERAASQGLVLRIGAHRDKLWAVDAELAVAQNASRCR